ncbi:FecCD family ABC transporter permease [Prauserella cavernicola]|uniref:Iron chelate uptake ABC transporter family permease subunit n=1 Tax=Prauserella cavernicola TaxID=2800127 RepID=A0A934V2Z9_9PSEU|nr:iron chelate uptake ABC transporter family permease subunit [Prauserella cavernicola]MBK1786671.1 iron chelate uptake ABC transporter family permease subunit [Prauserella cavernicola]
MRKLAGIGVLVLVAAALSLVVGTKAIPVGTVLDALVRFDPADPDHLIVTERRLPRTLAGLLVGAALGLAGAVIQGVTRNPLADPGILGVNAGAALCVVLGISVFGVTTLSGYVWFGFAGAALAAVLVYAIGSLGGDGASPLKLALTGAALTAALASVQNVVLLTDSATYDQFRFWRVGSLTGRDAEIVAQGAPFLLVGVVLALGLGKILNGLSLGDDVARSFGQNVTADRVWCAVAVVILCGAATAMAGPIGFLGLTVPHLARLLTGPDYRWILPYSMLLSPVLLVLADVAGRVVARPGEVQAGIVTAILGAPVFVLLVRRRKLAAL